MKSGLSVSEIYVFADIKCKAKYHTYFRKQLFIICKKDDGDPFQLRAMFRIKLC